MAFCRKCGLASTQETGFCGGCGAAINATAQASAAASTANAGWTPVNPAPQPPAEAPTAAPAAQGWSATPAASLGATGQNWTPVSGAPPAAATTTPGAAFPVSATPVSTIGAATAATGPGLTPNMAGALAYSLGIITGVLFLVLEPYRRDRFVRFHAMQSVLYFVAAVAFSIAWRIMVGMLMSISGWLALATVPIRLLISLGLFCLWLFLMYQAYSGREFSIPILGPIAKKHAESQG